MTAAETLRMELTYQIHTHLYESRLTAEVFAQSCGVPKSLVDQAIEEKSIPIEGNSGDACERNSYPIGNYQNVKENITMENTRTMALQMPEETYQRLEAYLKRHQVKQKDFVTRLVERAIDCADTEPRGGT